MVRHFMRVTATTDSPRDTPADTVVIGLFEGEGVAHDTGGGELQALVDGGEARAAFKHVAVAHADGRRWLLVGLGARDAFDAERARVAAATALGRAKEAGARSLCWELPHKIGDDVGGGFVEGTVLADYAYTVYKSDAEEETGAPSGLQELIVSAHHDVSAAVEVARVSAEAANAARDLQNAPANDLTPTKLAARARQIADELGLACEVLGREQIRYAGMGAFAAVADGTHEEPQLI